MAQFRLRSIANVKAVQCFVATKDVAADEEKARELVTTLAGWGFPFLEVLPSGQVTVRRNGKRAVVAPPGSFLLLEGDDLRAVPAEDFLRDYEPADSRPVRPADDGFASAAEYRD